MHLTGGKLLAALTFVAATSVVSKVDAEPQVIDVRTFYSLVYGVSKEDKDEVPQVLKTGTEELFQIPIPKTIQNYVCAVGPSHLHEDGTPFRDFLCVNKKDKTTIGVNVDCNAMQVGLQVMQNGHSLILSLSCRRVREGE